MVENKDIITDGLTMVYELSPMNHKGLDEYLYYKGNPTGTDFKHNEVIQVELGGVLVKFIVKESKLIINGK